jgi:hypothetical protein
MTEPIIFILLIGIFSGIGYAAGQANGKHELCREQFQGELHQGKCVKVSREEVK